MAHLSGFGLENFRVFKEYTWFDFAPITLFVGPNSSGKSSVIKALLLLEDNFKKKHIPHDNYGWEMGYLGMINFTGKSHNLQNENSIIPYNTTAKEIKFTLPYECLGGNPLRQPLFWESSYKIKEGSLTPGIITKLRTQTEDLFISDYGNDYVYLNTLILKNIFLNRGDKGIKSITDRDRNISNIPSFTTADSEFSSPQFDNLKHELGAIGSGTIEESLNKNGLWPKNSDILERLLRRLSIKKADKLVELIDLFLQVDSLNPAFYSWSDFIYVPSIKGLPKRYFKFDDDSEVLNRIFAHLESSRDKEHKVVDKFVRKWETEFDFKEPINWTKDVELGLTKIQIGNDYLSDLGFGISQLVAILLANYSTHPDGDRPNLLFLEEPEANLHPAFQSKLADMFVDADKTLGHQFIIETHSEYLIRKFQYLVAKGESKPKDIVIYYFHDPNNVPAGEKQVKKITILEDGSLSDDFGPGFYDEAAHWELELLKLKRNKGRQN